MLQSASSSRRADASSSLRTVEGFRDYSRVQDMGIWHLDMAESGRVLPTADGCCALNKCER